MVLQFVSDLHLEFSINYKWLQAHPIKRLGDILVIAGDLVPYTKMSNALPLLQQWSDQFEYVYWLPGNHEYYGADLQNGRINSFQEHIFSNCVLLNNAAIAYKGVRLLFGTLWSQIDPYFECFIQKGMGDFKLIRNHNQPLTIEFYNKLHTESLDFFKSAAAKENIDTPTVAITHHLPTLQHYPKEFVTSPLISGFATNLDGLVREFNFDYWIYGHHHSNIPKFKIGNTQFLTNQLGYVWKGESQGFDPNRILLF